MPKIHITKPRRECFRISAREGKDELGHVFLYLIWNDLHEHPYALVEDLGVHEMARHKGIGRMLMEAPRTIAMDRHCYKIIANSHEKRTAARTLYLSMGYRAHATEFRLDL